MTSLVTAKYDSNKNQILDPNSLGIPAVLATDPLTGNATGIYGQVGGVPNQVIPLSSLPAGAPQSYVTIFSDGDSKAAEPLWAIDWVKAKTPMYVLKSVNLGVGGTGSGTGTGITSPTRLALMQAQVATLKVNGAVDLVLTIGTNDIGTNTSDVIVANIAIYAAAFFSAGGRFLILMGIDPKVSSIAGYDKVAGTNAAYEAYARNTKNIIFCDTTEVFLDFTSAVNSPIGGMTNVRLTPMTDGLHCQAYGRYKKSIPLTPVVTPLYRPRVPRAVYQLDAYSTAHPVGNLIGSNGRFVALGGTNNSTGGTITGTPPLGWALWNALNGLSVTFTTTTSTGAQTALGTESTIPVVRMAISGTPSADTILFLQSPLVIPTGVAAGTFEHETLMYANALSGLFAIQTGGLGSLYSFLGDDDTSFMYPTDELPALTQLICMQNIAPVTSLPGSYNASILFNFKSGVAVSGSVDLIGLCNRRLGA